MQLTCDNHRKIFVFLLGFSLKHCENTLNKLGFQLASQTGISPCSSETILWIDAKMMPKSGSDDYPKILVSRTKQAPSKWDDAQKWLVGLSSTGDHSHTKNIHRKSNADDKRSLGPTAQNGGNSSIDMNGSRKQNARPMIASQDKGERKRFNHDESFLMITNPDEDLLMMRVRPVCVRNMGTEMTPIASTEPSRTATPLGATTPVLRSPTTSRPTTQRESAISGIMGENLRSSKWERDLRDCKVHQSNCSEEANNFDYPESRAVAWNEVERVKYLARYKREEVKIHSWENQEKGKAEMQMRKMEVKAERLKSRAQERLTKKLAAARRVAEEKRSNAEARLHQRAAKTSERSEYVRRTGHLPICFFSFKLPSLCS